LNSKCKRYFHNRLKPSKLTWTALFRKQHKKDVHAEAIKKKRRATNKPYSRSIVGASLEVIQKKRTEKTEVRAAAREAALREIKERIKKTKDEKKAKKVEVTSKPSKPGKAATRAPQAKPAKTGAGGKRWRVLCPQEFWSCNKFLLSCSCNGPWISIWRAKDHFIGFVDASSTCTT